MSVGCKPLCGRNSSNARGAPGAGRSAVIQRATLGGVSNGTTPERLGSERRLFVDLLDVDRRDNVSRTFHQARKHGLPVIAQEEPWERMGGMTASVIYDHEEGVFKAWYMAGFYAPGKARAVPGAVR